MKKYLFFICGLVLSATAWAQQIPMMTQAQVNPFLLNPAYAGNNDYTAVFLHARSLWAGMPDAPQQYLLTADGALNNGHVGLGLMLYSDVQPIIRNAGAMLAYRYKIRLGGAHFLSGALSGGFIQNSLDFDKAIVENPEELSDFRGRWSKFNFNLSAGLLYQFNGLDVGAVVKQLPNTPFTYDNTTTETSLTYRLIRHYELSAAYHWRFAGDFALKPLFVAQSIEGMPFNFMLNASVSYLDSYWVGVGYKLESAYSIIAGLAVADKLLVGYSCDIAAASPRAQFGLTHEVSIGYRFGRQAKKTAAAETGSNKKATRLQDSIQQKNEEIDRLKQSNEELQQRLGN